MALDLSRLNVDVQEGERWRRTLNITVPADLVQAERQKVLKTLSSKVRLPGFRKGKIPSAVLEKRFGGAVRQEMLDSLIGEVYRGVLQERDLRPISEGEVNQVEWENEEDLTFAVSFDVNPKVELARLGGFSVQRPKVAVADEDVIRVLERLREEQGSWKPEETGVPQDGDLASIEIARLDGSPEEAEPRGYEVTVGRQEAIPDVEEAIRTLEVGATGEFTVTFPEDFPDEERRGESRQLRITLKERKSMLLPDLDDDFATSLGDFGSLDDLRTRIRDDLQAESEEQAESQVRGLLLSQILEANPFEVPDSLAERYIESVLGDVSEATPEQLEEARTSLKPEAEVAVKRMLLLDRVAEENNLRATEEELDERIEAMAEKGKSSPAEIYARLQKSGRLESLEREITDTKVFDFLKSQSTITEAAS
ncbi:MAG: trigger factor [Gemmatimonadota bacterium]